MNTDVYNVSYAGKPVFVFGHDMKTNRLCNSCISHNQVPATHIQDRPLYFDELNKIYSNINQHVTRNSIEALRLAMENNILVDILVIQERRT
ncbi:hypothetical protein Q7C36_016350 [Tachysurus vachellii]|uniref:Uncharacterized protein n=1 Tax=Tachysurus vachellii TaxID=175792 RepID=A0AA88M671_TACVA|nr:hypothetical protein Q7C36_016350 [Tachysurus vachellii]